MYQALYRKYRPLVFEDVIGQEHVVNTVKNQIINNKISHAYMFTGTRGTGKTTCAKILARAVNCQNLVNGNPCNECETCKGILNGSLMDVFEIDAASNNGVDNIRELRDDVIFTPASAKYKVYIIDEVHMLSTQAFNALLKTLEEPPAHIIFVFATTEIHKVPQTILSRCQRFDFKRITVDDICNRLNYVAGQEGFKIEENACDLIARLADGAMRDALSVLDRCVDGSDVITLEKVERTVGICSYENIARALISIAESDTDSILEFYANCRRDSKDAVSLFSEICSYLRDLLLIKLSKNYEDLLSYDTDKLDALKEISHKFTVDLIIRSINILQNGIYDVSKFKDKHIMAEMTLIKLTNIEIGEDFESIRERLSRLESGVVPISNINADASASKQKQPAMPIPKKQSVKNVSPDEFWPRLVNEVQTLGGNSCVSFLRTIGHTVKDGIIKIHCDKSHFAYNILSMQSNVAIIKNAARQLTGTDYAVVFTEGESVQTEIDENDSLNELLNEVNDILEEE